MQREFNVELQLLIINYFDNRHFNEINRLEKITD